MIGDFHVPRRAREVPKRFLDKLGSERPDLILSQGDFTREDSLRALEQYGKVIAVRGNMEEFDLPLWQTTEAEGIKIGVIHGAGIEPRGDVKQLIDIAKKLGVKILVNGHTHERKVLFQNGILLVNPGSATGAVSGEGKLGEPSFMVMEIYGKSVKIRSIFLDRETAETYEIA